MKCKSLVLSMMFGLAALWALIAASNSLAAANPPIPVMGSEAATFVNGNFTYDFLSQAAVGTGSGTDNVGGPYTFQGVAEVGPTSSTPCTAPDGSAGLEYPFVGVDQINIYKTGLLYYTLNSPSDAECVSTTRPYSLGGVVHLIVVSGTGTLGKVSGTFTETFTGSTPVIGGGYFGAESVLITGSITK